jgi:hypothetical protein
MPYNMTEIVECLSSHTYAQNPVALYWDGRRLEIVKILAEWRTPGKKHFRVRAEAGWLFELVFTENPDALPGSSWQVHPIQE